MSNVIRPGRTHYTVATKAVVHGAPCTEDGFVGTAVKKLPAAAGVGLGDASIVTVAIGEKFHIERQGERDLPNVNKAGGTFAKGAAVYIDPVDNALTSAHAGAELKFGRVSEIAGEGRGIPAGSPLMRVNLDAKDGIA